MAQHPRTVSFAEARAVLEAFDWELRRVNGSHYIFRHPDRAVRLVIPLRRPSILPTYVRDILAATGGADDE
jgi:predicted RNA binding protein YcfA (HicA-like mRNA interferase family)